VNRLYSSLGLALGFVLLAGVAEATEEASAKIPPNIYGCTACHAGAGADVDVVPASTAAELSNFGNDWLQLATDESARLWADMAILNSDNDGCSNGCELDDPRGGFLPDQPFTPENCAPGDPRDSDCALPINEQSWSTLKSLFGDN